MRIAIFTDTYYPDINGVVSSIGILRNELMKHGHQVLIITTVPPIGVQMKEDSSIIRMNGISIKSIYGYRMAGIYNNKIFKQIKEFNPEIIHTQTEYGVGLFGRLCGYKLNIPTVYTFHTNLYDYTYYVTKGIEPFDSTAKKIVKKLMKVYTTHTTSLIVPSVKTASMMKSIGIKKEINIVPTGLELERFKIHNEEHTKQIKEEYHLTNHFNLISLGRLAEEKSLDLIISAMPEIIKRNTDIRLFIIGDGPAKESLMQLTHDLKMDDYIRFAGCQSADVIPDFYYSGDLFVSASLTETQGLTFIEAMASSLPVLARYDSNLDPVIIEGRNGHFFYSQEEYVDKVIELSRKDLTPYKEHAVKHAQQFDSHTFYEGVMKVYHTSIDHFENCYVVKSLTPHDKLISIEFTSDKRKIALECRIEDVEAYHLERGARVNQDTIDNDITLAGYNMLVTSEIKTDARQIYETYHNLWRIEESFRIMKSDLDARPVYLQLENTIKGHFLICYLTVLLQRIFQFKVLENKYSSSELNEFYKGFQLVEGEDSYTNISIGTDFITELSDMTGLPLDNYFLSPAKLKKVLNYRF